jgi:hypothetical protein
LCPGFLAGQQRFNGLFLRFEEGFQRLYSDQRSMGHLWHLFKCPVGAIAVVAPRERLSCAKTKHGGQGHGESFHLRIS